MKFLALFVLALGLSACGEPASLEVRQMAGHPLIAQVCLDHEKEVWTLNVSVKLVQKGDPALIDSDGSYNAGNKTIFLQNSLLGWYAEEVEFHERCHAWLHKTTGNPQFHHQQPLRLPNFTPVKMSELVYVTLPTP